MLANTKAFSGFSASDLKEAHAFYGDILGLTIKENPMGILELLTPGNYPIIIYPKPDHVPATFTVLNFVVDDLESTVDQLTAKGVVFKQYQGQLQTDAKGIYRGEEGPLIAWFKDPAGNILSVLEER